MKSISKMTAEDLRWEFEKDYQSKHGERDEEAYDFNIKIFLVNIPDIVREVYTANEIDEKYQAEAEFELEDLKEALKEQYPWIDRIHQTGRSGGWLTVVPENAVFLEEASLKEMRKRIRDLLWIENKVRIDKHEFKKRMQSPDFWEVGPRDWSPRVKRKK